MSIAHPQENFRCGDDWDFTGTITDNSGAPLNLTSASLTWKLTSLDLTTTYLTLTLGFGIQIISATAGTVSYGPTHTQTAALQPGTYYDLLQVTLSDGTEFTVIEGFINAAPKTV